MEKDTYNLVLTNLSTVHHLKIKKYSEILQSDQDKKEALLKEFNYPYRYTLNGEEKILYGVITNEPAVKYIMELLKTKNDEIDEIHFLASKTVRDKMNYEEKMDNNKKEITYLDQSHDQFFIEKIKDYCIKNNLNIPHFEKYDIEDNPNSIELINLSSTIASQIIKLKNGKAKNKKFNLYVEANGGTRDFILIVVAILRTLENENITLQKVVGVNFDPNDSPVEAKDTKNEIIDKTKVFLIYDLYSGIDEFINYGRSNKIQTYFINSHLKLTTNMKNVLSCIEKMSDAFNLCRPKEMMSSTKKLKNAISIYESSSEQEKEPIFSYLVRRIKNEYQEVFKSLVGKDNYDFLPLKQMIIYCLDHNLIQQALTLYSECIPHVLYNKKVFYVSSKENIKQHFDAYMNKKNHYPKPYAFIQQYMLVDDKKREQGLVYLYKRDNPLNRENKSKNLIERKCDILTKMLKDQYVNTKYDHTDAKKAMYNYLLIKEARNVSNHAGIDKSDIINKYFNSVENTKQFISDAIAQLDDLLKHKKK